MSRELRHSASLPCLDETHRVFAQRFAAWVGEALPSFDASEGGDGVDARRIFESLGAAGWLDGTTAVDDGGGGARIDLRRVCLMREALAYRSAIADVAFSEPWLGVLPLILHGTDDQRRRHLDGYRAGRTLLAFALSEAAAGSDVAALSAAASRAAQGYTIDGRKTWTSNAGVADGYVVFARIGGETGKRGITAFRVAAGQPGVELTERIRVLSPHTVGTLAFRAARADETIGEPGGGFDIAMRALALFRPTVAAACVGFARRALDEALARCEQRVAFGRPIAQHQLVQAKLADMALKVTTASLLTYHAAWCADFRAPDAAMAASLAKRHASEVAHQVVDEAVQLFGGLGVAHGQTVERLYRHVRAFRIFDGTSEIQQLIVARELLG